MKFDFVVLGATGMQGRIASRDLLEKHYAVLLCGRNKPRVDDLLKRYKKTRFEYIDVRNVGRIAEILRRSGATVCINCVEEDWNMQVMRACMKAGLHCLDLGSDISMTRKQLALHQELKRRDLISITGCGSVPGVGNVMLRHASAKFDKIESIETGFNWDSNIKKFVVPFSIQTIIGEFTSPASIVERGRFKQVRPLDTVVNGCSRTISKQKCMLVQHPETYTFYHYYSKKGLRNMKFYAGWPPHSYDVIMNLINLGLGSKELVSYQGVWVRPVEFLTEVLKGMRWPPGYTEVENLWVRIHGTKNGKPRRCVMECIVPTLKGWEDAGCNVDTGMPASIMAQMIKEGVITERGSFAPEAVVPPEPFFKELRKRKMVVLENGKVIN